jgi:hypothetical protein
MNRALTIIGPSLHLIENFLYCKKWMILKKPIGFCDSELITKQTLISLNHNIKFNEVQYNIYIYIKREMQNNCIS